MTALEERTIGELVAEAPLRANIFEKRRIDYCCKGRRSLAQVCAEEGLPIDELIAELEQEPRRESPLDWAPQPLTELAGHIVDRHHGYLRSALPSVALKLDKVVQAHADRHPALQELRRVFTALADELTSHMAKEEMVLFPHVAALEKAERNQEPAPPAPGGSVRNPIQMMEHEHDDAGRALSRIRELTSDHEPPAGACNTFRALYAQLAELERDLHTHIHLENNVLFPRAAELEERLRS
ncbi:MAG: iron-sulfur cluster repair di-iron protein [Bryobacterales bacterium]|nr:iron-sulfur cluster repair di-iron protein [Bryobacterales bacterium]